MERLNSERFREVIQSDKLVVVDFYADWCMPCRYISPILEKLSKEYNGEVEFYKLNVDENQDVAFEYGIASIPTVLFFRNGKVVGGFIGAMPESAVRAEIEKALGA
ncbi:MULTISPECIES: thioredoxin [Archaeoglobus]|jgi:thioredoxin 1|uniref:Thioredoxin (Trx-4) n=3 Tax=Archaeoglobus fulgidus TaxID=2234 RepID=O28138_ARCFU|nr:MULTISPECIES: thioredoxin [Archaeoglobus]AAB89115.1 thioredoxin (trx-4) [Archaeoglobus fulgidus DSM 4304]AIG99131.1 thioredoxin [Archaeoglobus fulgidus DSM 8774]KUJ92979.1 MAG: Thioredoxin (Trx-4) [Archaeoglobus fulgidus]KUK06434.1 MAG: Thioredoxin (Trx-4) [Archaeoglobus fulgidus]MDI3498830.1 thioredoxin 1 [Archaeoglobus sp.]